MTILLLLLAQATPAPGHWPQWRGADRDSICKETGLLKEWPEGGPKLLWTATGFGEGIPPVSVAGGGIFLLGYRENQEFVTALDGNGRIVWSVAIGPHSGESQGMRFLSQRPVVVDGPILFAVTAQGIVHCLQSASGKSVWSKKYSELDGQVASFFYTDSPVVEGDLLICKPGGSQGTLAALKKTTGAPVWRSSDLKDRAGHAAVVPAEIGGIRQVVVLTHETLAGVDLKTGRVLWRTARQGQTAVVPTPIVHDDFILVSSGFNVGCSAFRIVREGNAFKAEPVYQGRQVRNNRGGMVRFGDHVYDAGENGALQCVEFKTGTPVWQDRCIGLGSVLGADGRLIVMNERGALALAAADPAAYALKGRLQIAPSTNEPTQTHPVVAGGRLYVRILEKLYCFDLRGPDYQEPAAVWKIALPPPLPSPAVPLPIPPAPKPKFDAAYVPTPQDVVLRMLELARVSDQDRLVDLGSGDGRILLTSFRKYGCKALGYEINPELVGYSRTQIREAGLDPWVKVEEKDLFTADLSEATVVTLYLGEKNNERLLPQLRKLPAGARIVSHQHTLGSSGPKPDKSLTLRSREDGDEHVVHFWTAPLQEAGK